MYSIPDIDLLDRILEATLTKEAFAKKKKTEKPVKNPEEFKATQKKEIEMWHTWNDNGRKPEHLKPIYNSFKNLLQNQANKFRGLELPKTAIDAEIRKHFLNALSTYNPNHEKGTQLNSWITHHIRKSSRFVKNYQNLGRISERQISGITEFKQTKADLFDKLGYEPDTKTLADTLKWPHKRVIQLQKELREDVSASGFGEDPGEIRSSKELEAIRLLQYDNRLSPEERSVYEYTFGMNGKPKLQPGHIAKRTNLHPSKVSRIRGKIKTLVQEALDVL